MFLVNFRDFCSRLSYIYQTEEKKSKNMPMPRKNFTIFVDYYALFYNDGQELKIILTL